MREPLFKLISHFVEVGIFHETNLVQGKIGLEGPKLAAKIGPPLPKIDCMRSLRSQVLQHATDDIRKV